MKYYRVRAAGRSITADKLEPYIREVDAVFYAVVAFSRVDEETVFIGLVEIVVFIIIFYASNIQKIIKPFNMFSKILLQII